MKRTVQATSADSSAKRSSAAGSRSIAIRVPAGPIRSATSRAWPPPPKVQSTAISPGCGSRSSISSPASTGTWVLVMSSSVAKARRNLRDSDQDVIAVGVVLGPVEHLQALSGARHNDLFVQLGVIHQRRRDHHAIGGVKLGVVRVVEEEPLEVARLRRKRAYAGQSRARVGVVTIRGPDG